MQYCCLHHQTLLSPPDTSATGCHFRFGPGSSFFLELFLCLSTVACWTSTLVQVDLFFGIIVLQFMGHLPGGSMVGIIAISSKKTYANMPCLPELLLLVPLSPRQATADSPPQETTKHSQAGLAQFLAGVTAPLPWVLVCTRFCLCPPRVSGKYRV